MEKKEFEAEYAAYMPDNRDFKNKNVINMNENNEDHLVDFQYASRLDSESVKHFIKSHGLLYGRYLNKDGSLSMPTHAIYQFPEKFDKFEVIFDHLRKDIKQEMYTNSVQTQLMKNGISDSSLQGKIQASACCNLVNVSASGNYKNCSKNGNIIDNNSSKMKLITRRDTCFAKVKISDECLHYTKQFAQDLASLLETTNEHKREIEEVMNIDDMNMIMDMNDDNRDAIMKRFRIRMSKNNNNCEKDESNHKVFRNEIRYLYDKWNDFFHKYGHFTIASATVGGTLYICTDIETNDNKEISYKMNEMKKYFSIDANASAWKYRANGDISYNNDTKNEDYSKNINFNKNINCTLECIGGNPILAGLHSIHLWEKSLIKHFQSWDIIKIEHIESWYNWLNGARIFMQQEYDRICKDMSKLELQFVKKRKENEQAICQLLTQQKSIKSKENEAQSMDHIEQCLQDIHKKIMQLEEENGILSSNFDAETDNMKHQRSQMHRITEMNCNFRQRQFITNALRWHDLITN